MSNFVKLACMAVVMALYVSANVTPARAELMFALGDCVFKNKDKFNEKKKTCKGSGATNPWSPGCVGIELRVNNPQNPDPTDTKIGERCTCEWDRIKDVWAPKCTTKREKKTIGSEIGDLINL